ncbi:MAG TPA: carbon starvation protein A [Vicinamibacterales bacterium]|nr:carbon starvation protein A [Vicinamibacterales bacterium]
MPALYIVLPILCILVIAYRYYSAFIAAKVMVLDDTRITPAHKNYDGQNYYPTSKWVLFGHHFAAITGAGPLIGPVLAAQFGYAPGFLWLIAGVVLAGGVHDFVILWASTRRGGKSLAEIARREISPFSGIMAAIAIMFVVVIALAGLGLVVVNALYNSPWGTFTIAATIPLAIFMGFYMFQWRKGKTTEATIIGVIGITAAVILGKPLADSSIAPWFTYGSETLIILMAVYTFAASVLPVWMLLNPRGYLCSFMKIGIILALAGGVMLVNPHLLMPALTKYDKGGGPIIPGPLYPFVFITIACGAISGFHALIASGTTPKMIDKETDIRPIGYLAMLCEGLVGVMALTAACVLHPADYFAINTSHAVFATLHMVPVNLAQLSKEVGETVAARPGGAVSLAVGMAQVFSGLPGMRGLMDYWYHFAIMFEALFVLTTLDAGTRVGRFLLQEFGGQLYAPLGDSTWLPGSIVTTLLIVLGWGYFIWTGSISTLWPMFGVANQLLATVALAIGTSVIINIGRAKYAWVTAGPLAFVGVTTLSAGWLSIRDNFGPMAIGTNPALHVQGWIDSVCTAIMMICVLLVLGAALNRWVRVFSGRAETLAVAEASEA